MNLKDLFDYNISDLLKDLKGSIEIVNSNSKVLSITGKDLILDKHDRTNILVYFYKEDKPTVIVHRYYKNRFNVLSWTLLVRKLINYSKHYKEGDTKCSFVIHREYIDLTFYKGWWLDWVSSE